ncbi:pSer/pThr/pTyr-binding forkhead associated (FHA) protein [Actinomadura pelletieri DSM 43383]|uniref:PSer/pThr/pTyr-binding forkhead associated (FHA) protein n=1 Tax=Actinomadura pelletieri DSM 43383 TaxID=1120940 RepID=A0A495QPS7_9ACTN|nr:FHA domain-containing protein [Actinomadura pelletieri]RKS74993.1 pSer/pThr/pTyr-binding forkhead associated (FHA) protein [Actinomadura pelletieri DSM 43383]
MSTCPNGHSSRAADYCDVCGERMVPSSPASPAGEGMSASEPRPPYAPPPPASGQGGPRPCPDCGTPGTDRFCEACGYDFATGGGRPTPRTAPANPAPPVPPLSPPPSPPPSAPPSPPEPQARPAPAAPATVWTAVVTADRDYYDSIIAEEGPDSASLTFPPYAPERRITLTGQQVRIGRRGSSQPSPPEIDLREPPEDPGISHVHAVLLAKPDGTWTLVDPGSTNGTCMNGSMEPIPNNVEVPVSDGDRIHVGAWTTITLIRGEAT